MKNVSIHIKITLFIVFFLLFTIVIVLFLSMSNSRKSLSTATDRTLRTNAQTIDRAIRSIMLSGEAPIAVRTIRSLQKIQDLEQIDLYRTNGSTAFHDYETLDFVNAQQQAFQFTKTPRITKKELDTPLFQNIINEKRPIKFEDKQNQHFEYYYPFQNGPECQMCHGKSKDILGVLHLKISTADLNMQIKKAGFMLSAILIMAGVLIAFCLIIFLNRLILDPLVKIGSIVAQVGQGNFDVKVDISRGDEIGVISDQINSMVRDLKEQDRIKRSLYLAQEVQQNLLPHEYPQSDNLEIAGKSIYCDETGGDYYDFIISDNDEKERIGIAVGDVSGHGISSALLMAAVRSSLRQRSSLPGSIGSIISDVNRQMVKDVEDSGQFITMFYLTIDPIQLSLQWVRAGHDPGIFYDPHSDTFEELHGSGVALGVIEDWNFAEYTKTALKKGQIIFLSTDGLKEARNNRGEMFGNEPVYDIIRKNASSSANEILNALFESLNSFLEGTKIEDDITLVVVKISK
jgi:serine phosphatase RsbU (regulator of sigma subunit)